MILHLQRLGISLFIYMLIFLLLFPSILWISYRWFIPRLITNPWCWSMTSLVLLWFFSLCSLFMLIYLLVVAQGWRIPKPGPWRMKFRGWYTKNYGTFQGFMLARQFERHALDFYLWELIRRGWSWLLKKLPEQKCLPWHYACFFGGSEILPRLVVALAFLYGIGISQDWTWFYYLGILRLIPLLWRLHWTILRWQVIRTRQELEKILDIQNAEDGGLDIDFQAQATDEERSWGLRFLAERWRDQMFFLIALMHYDKFLERYQLWLSLVQACLYTLGWTILLGSRLSLVC